LLRKGNDFSLNSTPPKDRAARIKQPENLTGQDRLSMRELDKIFYQDTEGLDELLFRFVTAHRNEFPTA
jgi:hypothetical protein